MFYMTKQDSYSLNFLSLEIIVPKDIPSKKKRNIKYKSLPVFTC